MEAIQKINPESHKLKLKDRAWLYVDMILDLIDELPPESETAQEVHRTIMGLPEYWEL